MLVLIETADGRTILVTVKPGDNKMFKRLRAAAKGLQLTRYVVDPEALQAMATVGAATGETAASRPEDVKTIDGIPVVLLDDSVEGTDEEPEPAPEEAAPPGDLEGAAADSAPPTPETPPAPETAPESPEAAPEPPVAPAARAAPEWTPLPPEPTMTEGLQAWDRRTHIERLNETGSGNPAHVPGQGIVHTRDTIGGKPK